MSLKDSEEKIIKAINSKHPSILDLPANPMFINRSPTGGYLIEFITANFENKETFTPDVFDFIQTLLDKANRNNDKVNINVINSIISILAVCENYSSSKRSDLIPYLHLIVFKKMDFSCFVSESNLIADIPADLFYEISKEKANEIYNDLNNISDPKKKYAVLSNFNQNQIFAFSKNSNINRISIESFLKMFENVELRNPNASVNNPSGSIYLTASSVGAVGPLVLTNSSKNTSVASTAPLLAINETPIGYEQGPFVISGETGASGTNILPLASSTEFISVPIPTSENPPSSKTLGRSINDIRKHLDEFDQLDGLEYGTFANLKLDNNNISIQCMLHFLSKSKENENSTFLKDNANECSDILNNYLQNNSLDLSRLISLSSNKSFLDESTFYQNLHGFIISMVSLLSTNDEFTKTPRATQRTILTNLQAFIKQSLDYLNAFMNKYGVIDDKLINSSYNLLYLLNTLTIRRAAMGTRMEKIRELYQQLINATQRNIDLYSEIKINEPISEERENIGTTREFDDVTQRLLQRLQTLESEWQTLQKNVKQINSDANNLIPFTDKHVIELANSLKTK